MDLTRNSPIAPTSTVSRTSDEYVMVLRAVLAARKARGPTCSAPFSAAFSTAWPVSVRAERR